MSRKKMSPKQREDYELCKWLDEIFSKPIRISTAPNIEENVKKLIDLLDVDDKEIGENTAG